MSYSSNSNSSSHSHRGLFIVLASAGLVVVLAFLSAFVWPGWALNHSDNTHSKHVATAPKTPSIQAKKLPTNASALLKAMPDSVLDFARVDASASAIWNNASPLEEYTLKYSTGENGDDVSVIVAQWPTKDSSTKQYEALVSGLKGDDLATGKIQVSSKTVGSYIVRSSEEDKNHATVIWQNDTAVFQVSGAKQAVERFYRSFPM
ncbi:hypothetical protein HXT27_03470 [Gardnerella sp. DNF00502]|uniref:hypothetical protein n=1 Tax=unclassified Gardnerella TaxID=2628112 RepID=UPI000C9EDCDE|nr:hypothetical protein [Gardnerella sp. KA00735]PNP89566.1 hypothetical protein BFS08_00935 [Gardnerella sp. KA00735]